MIHRSRFYAGLLMLLATLATATARVLPQATAPTLPEPISTIKLHRLLEAVVEPDDKCWTAIESRHDAYLAAFATLRDNEIERAFPEGPFDVGGSPDPRVFTELRTVVMRIRAVDEDLFDALQELLGPESKVSIDKARARRAIENANSTLVWTFKIVGGRLAIATRQARLTAEERALIDPVLNDYEQQVAGLLTTAIDRAFTAFDAARRAVHEAGLDIVDPHDGAANQHRVTVWSTVLERFKQEQARSRSRITAIEQEMRRRVLDQLSFDARREVGRCIEIARGMGDQYPSSVEYSFRRVLAHKHLDPAQRERVSTLYREWALADEKFVDELLEFELDGTNETANRRVAIQQRRIHDAGKFWSALQSVEPPIDRSIAGNLVGRSPQELDPFAALDDASLPPVFVHRTESIPDAMDASAIDRLVRRADLDEVRAGLLRELHGEHVERWRTELRPFNRAMARARDGLRAAVRAGGADEAALLQSRIDAIVAMRARAAALDDEFFQNIATPLPKECGTELDLAKLSRALERDQAGDWSLRMRVPASVSDRLVDVVAAMDAVRLPEETDALVAAHILARAAVILDAARGRADAQTNLYEIIDLVEMQGPRPGLRSYYETRLELVTRGLASSRVVRAAYGEAIADLDQSAHDAAVLAFERASNPDFFRDDRSAEWLLEAAAGLPTLSPDETAALRDLQAAHKHRMAIIAARAGDLQRAPIPDVEGPLQSNGTSSRDRAPQRAIFERDELSARTVSKLRRILDAKNRAAIAGLDDYERRVETVTRRFIW